MGDEALLSMIHEVQSFKKTRMIGSAAMAMVFVARGWAEVYREESSWIWDIAAGAALVEAAGGEVRISRLQPNGQLDILATNGRLLTEEPHPSGP
jgi:myo-inositol-1(or 4)-monophosphatase